jgi:hypothetical protein
MCAGAVACGSGAQEGGGAWNPVRNELPGWRAVPDPPGIAELAPQLSGLRVTSQVDAPALVLNGDAVRASKFVFGTGADAAAALSRARADGFVDLLFEKLHGRIQRLPPRRGVGYRVTVTRPAEPGQDTVELYVLRRGRTVVLVELLSATGFDAALRETVLAAVSR